MMSDLAYKLYKNKYGLAIRRGMLKIFPLILISSIFHIVIALVNSNLLGLIPISIASIQNINNLISSIIKPLSVVTICYSLVQINNERNQEYIHPLIAAPLAAIIAILFKGDFHAFYANELFNASNVVLFITIGIIVIEIYSMFFRRFKKSHWNQNIGYDLTVTDAFMAVIPGIVTLSFCCFICTLLKISSPLILRFLYPLLVVKAYISGFPIIEYLIEIVKVQFIWFFGGHGGNIIQLDPIHKSLMSIFSQLGGAGATLGLIIAILMTKTNNYYKGIAKLSLIPSIFNINESIIFGIPILFNPIYFIPFLITPVILSLTTISMMELGFLNPIPVIIDWSVPLIEDSYLVGGINGIIVQALNLVISVLIYLPFVHLSEDIHKKLGNRAYESLKDEVFNLPPPKRVLTRKDNEIGIVSRTIAKDLMVALKRKDSDLYLEYQPQVNQDGRVIGVEALLRYKHKKLGNIPPNIVVMLAEELNLISDLGAFIFNQACEDLSNWNKVLDEPLEMSVNISAMQVRDPQFYRIVKHGIQLNELEPSYIKLEITETLALGNDEVTEKQLKYLSAYGVKLVIDDFGPGYNPILYIKKFNIYEIKLDGSLVRDIETNKESQDIIRAMHKLCEYSNAILVAEFVETEAQKELLQEIGPMIYQGYLYSKPISAEKMLEYIKKNWEAIT